MQHREAFFLAMVKSSFMRGIGRSLGRSMPAAGMGNSLLKAPSIGAGRLFPGAGAAGRRGGGMFGKFNNLRNLFSPRNPFQNSGNTAQVRRPVGSQGMGAARLPRSLSGPGNTNPWW